MVKRNETEMIHEMKQNGYAVVSWLGDGQCDRYKLKLLTVEQLRVGLRHVPSSCRTKMTSIKLPHKSVRYTTAMSFSMPVRSFVRLSVA